MFFNTGSGGIDIFEVKLTFEIKVKFNDCSKKYKLCNMFELHSHHSQVSTVAADDLAPIECQDICDHPDDICQSAYI